jgi:modulator of FtsH protease
VAYDPAPWHDFFVMLGGASAALAGLVFVGLSIHARAVAADPLHRVRARNLTAGIVYVTVVAALVLTPGQGRTALGIELVVGGLLIGFLFSAPLRLHLARLEPWLRIRIAAAVGACLLSVVGGATLLAHAGGGLYLLVPSGLAGVVLNVFGAWSLLLGLAHEG